MLQQLASMKLTTVVLGTLALWLAAGLVCLYQPALAPAFKQMDALLMGRWLASNLTQSPGLSAWLIGLCLGVGVLVVNLAACCLTRLWPALRRGASLRQGALLVVHLLFAVVLVGHLLGFFTGYKHDHVRLAAGQSFSFGEGLSLTVGRVNFVDDPAVLVPPPGQRRPMMTRDNFHTEENFADVRLQGGGRELAAGRLHLLRPLACDNIQVSLAGFAPGQGGGPMQAVLVVSNNPGYYPFFVAYPLMILSLALYVAVVWLRSGQEQGLGREAEGAESGLAGIPPSSG